MRRALILVALLAASPVGAESWLPPRADLAAMPASGNASGDARLSLADGQVYYWTGSAWSALASGSGTVSSVALAAPSLFTISGSPVTTTGTLTLALSTQTANTVFAGPTTGSAAAPTFRALVAADIPSSLTSSTSGNAATATALQATLGVAGGGTGATSLTAYAPVCGGTTTTGAVQSCSSGIGTSGYVLTSNGASALPSWQAAAGGVSDHGALTGLADDDHAQYGLLAGRSGGQILIGGTGSGDQLSLIGSSNSAGGDSNSVNIFGDDDGSPRRRGVLRIYGSYTDADNYSRLSIYGTEARNLYVLNEGAGAYAGPWYIRIANPGGGVGIWADRLEVEKALQLDDPGSRPTCDSSYRGWVWTDFGGAGVADKVEICTKDAADAYAWRTLI